MPHKDKCAGKGKDMTIFVTEYRFKGNAEWPPRGDGKRIDAYADESDAEKVVARESSLFGDNTDYRVANYERI